MKRLKLAIEYLEEIGEHIEAQRAICLIRDYIVEVK